MTPVTTVTPAAVPARAPVSHSRNADWAERAATPLPLPHATAAPLPRATDDEILGIVSPQKKARQTDEQLALDFDADELNSELRPATAGAVRRTACAGF